MISSWRFGRQTFGYRTFGRETIGWKFFKYLRIYKVNLDKLSKGLYFIKLRVPKKENSILKLIKR